MYIRTLTYRYLIMEKEREREGMWQSKWGNRLAIIETGEILYRFLILFLYLL